jgi:hypothetical protein
VSSGRPSPFLLAPAERAWAEKNATPRSIEALRGLHGHVSACGLARLAPILFFCFLFFLPSTWRPLLGRPTSQTRAAQARSRPFLIFEISVFNSKNEQHPNANNFCSTHSNQMKPIEMNQNFHYLSNATGPIFLEFFYKFWNVYLALCKI